eukprot:UN08113
MLIKMLLIFSKVVILLFIALAQMSVLPQLFHPQHFYYERNVVPTARMVKLAAEAKVKKFVILGSYTAYFALKLFPDLDLMNQGYPSTRVMQELVSINEGSLHGIDVCVLRLPYIFGVNRETENVPLWAMYLDWIKKCTKSRCVIFPRRFYCSSDKFTSCRSSIRCSQKMVNMVVNIILMVVLFVIQNFMGNIL